MGKTNTQQDNGHVEVIKMEKCNIPLPYEDVRSADDRKMITYGTNNTYPNFLLGLYNDSPIHAAIINSKSTYIIGDGLKYTNGSEVKANVNGSDGFNEFYTKCIQDYLIFNCFAVEVIYNSFGEPIEYFHVPVHKVRTNKSKTFFWHSEDWKLRAKSTRFDRFKPNAKSLTSNIYFFDGYFPSLNNVYPTPEYNGCIKSISTDIAIRDFNLNNIKNHFSVSTLITFFNGSNLSDEVKQKIVKELRDSYSGENGKKMIVDFQNPNGKSASVSNISPGDWDKAYVAIAQNVADDIYRGHQVTSPMLMGVKTEGQLGGASELETAYEIFKNTYIRQKRNELEEAFNYLFSDSTLVTGKLQFTDKPLFSTQISDSLKQQIYTINELRKEAGLPALSNGNRLLNEPSPVQQAEEEKPKENVIKRELTEDDFEKVKHLGTAKDSYDVVEYEPYKFDLESDIANWLLKNNINGKNLKEVVKRLSDSGIDVTVDELKQTLTGLKESGVINTSIDGNGNITLKPVSQPLPDTDEVSVVYDYQKRPGIKGATLIPTSRSFCRKIVESNKYYTREDIQEMSRIFGYSVFDHAGGWYYNPETEETTNICRHHWVRVRVKPKKEQ